MGVPFRVVTEASAVSEIVDAAIAGRGHWTITANVDHVRRCTQETSTRELIDEADLVVADGAPLVWASRLAGTPLPERVAGSTLVEALCAAASRQRCSVYLLGGDAGVAAQAATVLAKRYEGLRIAGVYTPARGFEADASEVDRICGLVVTAAPEIVLVGLGFPKQDLLIRRLRTVVPCASLIGVGISLSFIAGALARAPRWMHVVGAEWLYRLAQEPSRLWRRYIVHGLPFALRLLFLATAHRLSVGPEGAERWGYVDRGTP